MTEIKEIAEEVFADESRIDYLDEAVRIRIAAEREKLREDPQIDYPILHQRIKQEKLYGNSVHTTTIHEYIICTEGWREKNEDALDSYDEMFADE